MEVTMQAGGTAKLTISGGYYYYEVEPANPDIVNASVNDMTITLTAVGGGETTVTVKDVLTFRTIDIPVFVEYDILQLSSDVLTLIAGEQGTMDIISGSGSYNVQSNDEEVVTAMVLGNTVAVTAVGIGSATITVIDTKSGQTVSFEVIVTAPTSFLTCPDEHHPHMIDLGLPSGTKWACCNVDTEHPENQSPINYGGYYAWGETEEKSYYDWSNYIYCDGYQETCHNLGSNIAGTQYDVAHVKWGGSWVIPSFDQIKELLEKCSSQWITKNGVNGMTFTGPSGGTIFLPAAGYRLNDGLYNAGSGSGFWSSTQSPLYSYCAYRLYFNSDLADWYEGSSRRHGRIVRPVATIVDENTNQEGGDSTIQTPDGYELDWNDEFDGITLGTDWVHEVKNAGWVNNEKQNYVDDHDVTVVCDGTLKITCKKENGKIYSGRIYGKKTTGWKYGWVEARIKLPKGKGTWPAFWMMPVNESDGWPTCGEIDIMEEVGYHPNYTSSSIHCYSYNHTKGTQKTAERYTVGAEDDFHVYALEWTENYIQTYVDGIPLLHFDNDGKGNKNTWPFNKEFYVILNLAWGGDWGGAQGVDESALPTTMEVDYVRVYHKK